MNHLKSLLISFSVFIAAICAIAVPVFAQSDNPPTFLDAANLVAPIIHTLLSVAVVVFFIMLIVGGFAFITANGDAKRLEAGKKGILFSILGFALVFIPFMIIPLIGQITGVNTGFFSQSNGDLIFNLSSPFSATPLPSSEISYTTPEPTPDYTPIPTPPNPPTVTPTTDPSNGACGTAPFNYSSVTGITGPAADLIPIGQMAWGNNPCGNYEYGPYGKSIYNAFAYAYVACVQAALAADMNAFMTYMYGIKNLFTIEDALKQFIAIGDFSPYYGGSAGTGDVNDSQWEEIANNMSAAKGYPNLKWNATTYLFDHQGAYDNAISKGIPVIMHIVNEDLIPNSGHDEIDDYEAQSSSSGACTAKTCYTYIGNPANISDYYVSDWYLAKEYPTEWWAIVPTNYSAFVQGQNDIKQKLANQHP